MLIEEKDVRAVVRLVGEVAAIRGDHSAQKRFLVGGLCELIGADSWFWGLSCQRQPDKPQMYVSIVKEGFTDHAFVKFLEAVEHPEMIQLASRFFEELKETNAHLTRSRYEIADAEAINQSQAIQIWKAANIGPTILSMRPLDSTSSSVIGIYRHYGRKEFTPAQVRMAHIVLNEVSWLHEQGWPEDRGVAVPKLSKRQRLVLNLLTLGHSRKQIAAHMDISVHTVHEYTKEVYGFFGVHSQAELMRRFYDGNGGDRSSLPR